MKQAFFFLRDETDFFFLRDAENSEASTKKSQKKWSFLTFENFSSSFTLFHQIFFLTKMFLLEKSFERMKTIFDNSDNSIIKKCFLKKKRDDSTKKSGHF